MKKIYVLFGVLLCFLSFPLINSAASPSIPRCSEETEDKIAMMVDRYLQEYSYFERICANYIPYQVTLRGNVIDGGRNVSLVILDLEIGKDFEYIKVSDEFLSLADVKKLADFINSMPVYETRMHNQSYRQFNLSGRQNTRIFIQGQKLDNSLATLYFKLSNNIISVNESYEPVFATSDISDLDLNWKDALVFGSTTSIDSNEQTRLQEQIISLMRQLIILLQQRNL